MLIVTDCSNINCYQNGYDIINNYDSVLAMRHFYYNLQCLG